MGTIYNLQRYSLHDGPGIRSLVFFKGCPLRCRWCSNPESQSPWPELFYNRAECIGCGACASACGSGALKTAPSSGSGDVLQYDAAKCLHCFACASVCVPRALEVKGYDIGVEALVDELKKDIAFFEESGGGVTLSGGEPLAQPDFAAALLERLKRDGINTCIETCACVPREAFELVIPHTDLIYFDVKHADDSKHREFTGTGTEIIFENLAFILSAGCDVTVRIPVIPGFNHDEASMDRIAAVIAGLGVCRADLLPFHQFGEAKYRSLFRPYGLKAEKQLQDGDLAGYPDIFAAYGINARIGG